MSDDPHQFTRDAWEANADVWDTRMGDEGNDFFNTKCAPIYHCAFNAQSPSHPVYALLGCFSLKHLTAPVSN